MFSRSVLIVFLASLVATSGCSYHRDKNGDPAGSETAGVSLQSRATVDYATVRTQVFEPLCVSCHNPSNSQRADLTNYDSVKNWASIINNLVPKEMPKNKSISPEQVALLKAWIAAGAPQTVEAGTPPVDQRPVKNVPAEFRWSSFRAVVIEASCLKCHSGAKPADKLDLSTLDTVRAYSDKIIKRVVRSRDEKGVMPPKKENPLTEEQLRVLIEFFRYGMGE